MKGVATTAQANLDALDKVAEMLGDLCDSLVFIGGCVVGLLVTTPRAETIRVTRDVDTIAQVSSLSEYHALEERLRSRGFANDTSEGVPICRWIRQGIQLDLMPSQPGILPFHNRWYPVAAYTAHPWPLPSGRSLRVITAPVFLATKLEALKGRGNRDYFASHDLEDIVTVIDGRPELLDEARSSTDELKSYLAAEFRCLLGQEGFLDSLAAHLPGDEASQARYPLLLGRVRELEQISQTEKLTDTTAR